MKCNDYLYYYIYTNYEDDPDEAISCCDKGHDDYVGYGMKPCKDFEECPY